jgi:HAD superfamily hydrolase (TIGR01509 family)
VFTQALDRMGVAPAEAVFIDDRAANVAAARKLGITAIHFRDPLGLGAALGALQPR